MSVETVSHGITAYNLCLWEESTVRAELHGTEPESLPFHTAVLATSELTFAHVRLPNGKH